VLEIWAMERQEIYTKYGQNYDAIIRIGKYPLSKTLQLSDLGNKKEMKATTQRCYNEMKKEGLDISVIDYLCRISTLYVLELYVKSDANKYVRKIIERYFEWPEETKNLLRYFMKDPFFLLKLIGSDSVHNHMIHFQYISGLWFAIMEIEMLESLYPDNPETREKLRKEFWETQKKVGVFAVTKELK
jgi:hypothetical protein